MKNLTHAPKWGYHTWKDLGGPLGLLIDGIFLAFVVIAAFFMIVLSCIVVSLDYLFAPVLNFVTRPKAKTSA
jgi:hypothetical protein